VKLPEIKLSVREQVAVATATLVVVVWIFFSFVYSPNKQEIDTLRREIEAGQQNLTTMEATLTDVDRLEAEVLKEKQNLAVLKNKLSGEKRIIQILKQLSQETRRLNINLLSLSSEGDQGPRDSRKQPVTRGYQKQVITVTIECPYRVLSSYLKRLGELPFYVEVQDIVIERRDESFPDLLVDLTFATYVPTS
jgi:Tfp pilus assembly protein PilO